jgi:hypothetical protein
LSFFDETEERPRAARRSPPRGPGTDRQTLMIRRLVAGGVGLILLLLLVFAIRGCLDSRKEQALKDYATEVGALVQQSDQQSRSLFELLSRPGNQSAVRLQNAVNGFRSDAGQVLERARDTDHPDELDTAHRYLLESLEFRRDGIGAVARDLPTALGDTGRSEATRRIAAQMQNFLASDVIYSQRVIPNLQEPLHDEGLLNQVAIQRSRFLPDIEWLNPTTVADRIARIRGGAGDQAATPGLHGTTLGTVTVTPRGVQLNPQDAVEIPASEDVGFDVQVRNSGENDERDVTVKVTVTGAGPPIEVEERIDQIAAGEEATVSIPLAQRPPTGRAVTIQVEIQPVPGEKKVDNNRGRFPAVFSG